MSEGRMEKSRSFLKYKQAKELDLKLNEDNELFENVEPLMKEPMQRIKMQESKKYQDSLERPYRKK